MSDPEWMKRADPRVDAYFRCLGHAIAAEEKRALQRDANNIANALAGSTEAERKAAADKWNEQADALEAKLRAAIARRKGQP